MTIYSDSVESSLSYFCLS